MLDLGTIAFTSPLLLTALLLLPLIWWILRVSPPSPRLVRFPAIRLLFGLEQPEETPARTPLWLLLLRLLMTALLILALAHPILNPGATPAGRGLLTLVIDDGWASAPDWRERQAALDRLLEQAERGGQPVRVLTTAPGTNGEPPRPSTVLRPEDARSRIQALAPKPWPTDRGAAFAAFEEVAGGERADIVWLTDGLDDGETAARADRLQRFGDVTVMRAEPGRAARLLLPPEREGRAMVLRLARPAASAGDVASVRAVDAEGRVLALQQMRFEPGTRAATARLELPSEVLNKAAALRVADEDGAGTVVLLDEGWRRRPVGLITAGPSQAGHPLLDDLHFLVEALAPFTDLRRAPVSELVESGVAVVVRTDASPVTADDEARLAAWTESGGVLLRFAGPRLAESGDGMLPVTLRRGGRALGGALTWQRPQQLGGFGADSPFDGLSIPPDVTVSRQLLAEPSVDLASRTWARLEDGTPLVTGARRGDGWVVLVHTTANAEWSNLALSGLFVEMLQRLVALSQGIAPARSEGMLPPLATLDGFGRLSRPDAAVRPLAAGGLDETAVGPEHPPGWYGVESGRRAFNLSARIAPPVLFEAWPPGIDMREIGGAGETDLKPWLLLAATLLALLDTLVVLGLKGRLPLPRRSRAATVVVATAVLASVLAAGPASAQERAPIPPGPDRFALAATLEMRLAYVRTGSAEVDEVARAGLAGLGQMLRLRTSIEPAEPMAVDVEDDEIAFFPLLYWPIVPDQARLSPDARQRVAVYMKNGGMILFDTRDQGSTASFDIDSRAGTAERRRLGLLLSDMNVPPLRPVPADHVLTKAFYLLNDFPGRWAGGTLWVEEEGSDRNDGVTGVVIGGNDWAAAWATDRLGQPMFPVVPGGEAQREIALRFGINLVMHALTGNYKADQVHVPAILQRLGE